MKIISIACNNCGAPLDVPLRTRYLTCSFCESRLEVQHSGNAYFTSVLEAVQDLRADVQRLRIEKELEKLDEEWLRHPENQELTDRFGRMSIPTPGHATLGWIVALAALGFGFWAFSYQPLFGIGGLVAAAVALSEVKKVTQRAARYHARRQDFEERRRKILAHDAG